MMKKEIRVIGIDDSPFRKSQKNKVLVVGSVFRGGLWLDGVLSTSVVIDGDDATKKIAEMINKSKFKPQLQCIFINGIAVAGFNIIDINQLSEKAKLPVIVVIRKKPNMEEIKSALIKINKKGKIKLLEKAGHVIPIGKIYVQLSGIGIEKAKVFLNIACTRSLIPEPIRISHLIASGIIQGESRGKA